MKPVILRIVTVLLLMFLPIKASLITALVLIILDFIFGVWASIKRGEKVTSTGFKRTVIKVMVYELCIMLAYLVEHYLTQGFLPATNIASSFVGLTELKSILENLEDIANMPILQLLMNKLSQQDTAAALVEGYNPLQSILDPNAPPSPTPTTTIDPRPFQGP